MLPIIIQYKLDPHTQANHLVDLKQSGDLEFLKNLPIQYAEIGGFISEQQMALLLKQKNTSWNVHRASGTTVVDMRKREHLYDMTNPQFVLQPKFMGGTKEYRCPIELQRGPEPPVFLAKQRYDQVELFIEDLLKHTEAFSFEINNSSMWSQVVQSTYEQCVRNGTTEGMHLGLARAILESFKAHPKYGTEVITFTVDLSSSENAKYAWEQSPDIAKKMQDEIWFYASKGEPLHWRAYRFACWYLHTLTQIFPEIVEAPIPFADDFLQLSFSPMVRTVRALECAEMMDERVSKTVEKGSPLYELFEHTLWWCSTRVQNIGWDNSLVMPMLVDVWDKPEYVLHALQDMSLYPEQWPWTEMRSYWGRMAVETTHFHDLVEAAQSVIASWGEKHNTKPGVVRIKLMEDGAVERQRVRNKQSSEITKRWEGIVASMSEEFGWLVPAVDPVKIAALNARFPHFKEVTDFVQRRMHLERRSAQPVLRLPPILLTGNPGLGKTRYLFELSSLCGTPCRVLPMSSMTTGFTLSGLDLGYSTGKMGMLVEHLMTQPIANSIFVLDELDKCSVASYHRDDPYGPLYQLLEPSTAKVFRDNGFMVPVDCSHVLWFATANDLNRIPEPIVNRFKVFKIRDIQSHEVRPITESIYQDILDEASWGQSFDRSLSDSVITKLGVLDPRGIRAEMMDAVANAAERCAGTGEPIVVQVQDLEMETFRKPGIGFC